MKITIIKLSIFLNIVLFSLNTEGQIRTNMDIFFQLADSAALSLLKKIPAGAPSICLKASPQQIMSVFESRIILTLKEAGKNVLTASDSNAPCINIGIGNAQVKYPDIFRDGLFGGYLLKRDVSLSFTFHISHENRVTETGTLSFSYADTVDQNSVRGLENPVHPFTHGDLPGEPIFQSLIEPVIALAALGTIIYLFFSVRSK